MAHLLVVVILSILSLGGAVAEGNRNSTKLDCAVYTVQLWSFRNDANYYVI